MPRCVSHSGLCFLSRVDFYAKKYLFIFPYKTITKETDTVDSRCVIYLLRKTTPQCCGSVGICDDDLSMRIAYSLFQVCKMSCFLLNGFFFSFLQAVDGF